MMLVSHHDDDKAPLLRDCLVPVALRWQAANGGDCFLERHWLRGPHVRLVVDPDAPLAGPVAAVEGYLAEHPSTASLDRARHLRLSGELGRAELISPPYGPVRPDNTVSVEPYPEDASTVLLGASGYRLKARFMSLAVPPLGHALDRILAGAHPVMLAMGALVANASRWPVGGLVTGQISYRSHLEDHLANNDPDGRIRAVFAGRFAANGDRLRAAFRRQVAVTDKVGYHGDDAYLAAWSTALDAIWPAVREAAGARAITEDLGPGYLAQAGRFDAVTQRQWRFGADRPSSEFHHELGKLNYLSERVNVADFAAYRFVTNQFTRWLPLLGVAPIERYFASYAVCELTESEFGVSWRDQLARLRADPHAVLSPGRPA